MDFVFELFNHETFEMVIKVVFSIVMSILFIKGEVNMSKYAQSFSNFEKRFILNNSGSVIQDSKETDLQEEMNSHKDDCLSTFLDKYLDFSKDTMPFAVDNLADAEYDMLHELVGVEADKVLEAYNNLCDIRERYDIPDNFTNEELVSYLRNYNVNSKGVEFSEEKKDEGSSESS